jgi:hypothetical protein
MNSHAKDTTTLRPNYNICLTGTHRLLIINIQRSDVLTSPLLPNPTAKVKAVLVIRQE